MVKISRALIITVGILFIGASAISQDLGAIGQEKPVTIHGSTGLNLMAYGVNGIEPRQDPFSYVLSANATLSIYGFQLPFSVVLSNKQRSYSQPFNQFGLSPRYKWITLHAGYRNVTWSGYTLAGHTFLGGGLELNPGLFRFGFIYGRFDKKTSGNSYNKADPLPVYTRSGMAFKLGVGTEKNFFDLIVLRITDDSNSVKQPDSGMIRTPNQNVVSGVNSRFTILKKVTWENEVALSLYSTNTGAKSLDEIESNEFLSTVNKFLGINQSTVYNTAIRSSLNYKGKGYTLKLEYKRIDPNYRSLGAYFFNNDLQNITFSPSFSLFKRKVTVSGSIGMQNDNLRKSKKATTDRAIGILNLSINPAQMFGIDLGYTNYSLNQKSGTEPLVDSVKVHQSNQSVILTPRLVFAGQTKSQVVLLNYNLTFLNDKNLHTSGYNEYRLHSAQLNYNIFLLQSQWSFTAGITWSQFHNFSGSNTGAGATLGVAKTLLGGKLNLGWNNACSYMEYQEGDGWVINSNLVSGYNITEHHSLKLNLYYTGNHTISGTSSYSFNEFKGDLSYVFTF